jgi:hypothetical protein
MREFRRKSVLAFVFTVTDIYRKTRNMYRDYDEQNRYDLMQKHYRELLTLDHHHYERATGKNIKPGPISTLIKVWKKTEKAGTGLYSMDSPWICPGVAACGAAVLKFIVQWG